MAFRIHQFSQHRIPWPFCLTRLNPPSFMPVATRASAAARRYLTVRPHKLFCADFPHPRPPKLPLPVSPASLPSRSQPSIWTESPKTLSHLLEQLQCDLRYSHKRDLDWPDDSHLSLYVFAPESIRGMALNSYNGSDSPRDYLLALLRPVAGIFNQLHSKERAKILDEAPLLCLSFTPEPGEPGVRTCCCKTTHVLKASRRYISALGLKRRRSGIPTFQWWLLR